MTVEGFDLSGKRALVAGSGSPVGRTIVSALNEAGALVAVSTTSDPDVDLTAGGAIGLVREVVGDMGGLDVFVNCGDLRLAQPFEELTDAEWERLVLINLTQPIRLLRAAGRAMLAQGGGRIIQLVSMPGKRGVPNSAAYGACQAGLIQVVRTLALEWARRNVRVNGIGLGWFEGDPLVGESPLLGTSPHPSPIPEGEGAGVRASPGDQLVRYLPMRRLGRAEEVGALAVYLASDAADMMTGQTVWLDGAALAHA